MAKIPNGNVDFQGTTARPHTHTFTGGEIPRFVWVEAWGHWIKVLENSMECLSCNMEESIPEVFIEAGGQKEAAYRLYIFGKFKNTECETEEQNPLDESAFDRYKDAAPAPHDKYYRTVPNNGLKFDDSTTYLSVTDGTRVMLDGEMVTCKDGGLYREDGSKYHP